MAGFMSFGHGQGPFPPCPALPPRPPTPPEFTRQRRPLANPSMYARLTCLLTNYLQSDLHASAAYRGRNIFNVWQLPSQGVIIHSASLSPNSVLADDVRLSTDMNLNGFVVTIRAIKNKSKSGNTYYSLTARLQAYDQNGGLVSFLKNEREESEINIYAVTITDGRADTREWDYMSFKEALTRLRRSSLFLFYDWGEDCSDAHRQALIQRLRLSNATTFVHATEASFMAKINELS
ncbi:uncharacterized protein LY89DRAFT_664817 [Mollisia scopiformis]|uniref:Uncharacterized protein n=1 Tax=Mollisia scopiformis TaxID=149040 RepID=A0A194XNF5_MOLSC|nr:uncharacterized protein LY89DRAFT_664817 [Mollisia scopiformis]KUJ21639.1 hypothetical protein LY89DRAFT_664817 [Mollisia scopiformis]